MTWLPRLPAPPPLKPITWKEAVLAAIILIVIDLAWLNINSKMFTSLIVNVQKSPLRIRYSAAFGAYAVLTVMLWVFALPMARASLVYPFLLGFLSYALFDFTNLAFFTNYQWYPAILDMVWGGTVMALTCWLTRKAFSHQLK